MSAARTTIPRLPFLIALTTSLTPLLRVFSLLRWRTSLSILPLRESLARGLAMGELQKVYVCSVSMLILLFNQHIPRMNPSKQPSIYMRFHVTLEKAITFIRAIYGSTRVPGSEDTYFQLALKTAGQTEDIERQDYIDYHLTWLTGLLCDALQFNEEIYRAEIQNILSQLQDVEGKRVQRYIELLNYSKGVPKGESYKRMLKQVDDMDNAPCFIMIFKLYYKCHDMKGKSMLVKDDYEAFSAYAYLIYYKSVAKNQKVGQNLKQHIKDFFKQLEEQFGGPGGARNVAKRLFSQP